MAEVTFDVCLEEYGEFHSVKNGKTPSATRAPVGRCMGHGHGGEVGELGAASSWAEESKDNRLEGQLGVRLPCKLRVCRCHL